ncbi:MAG: hypothetical protein C4523_10600 [Myxococcales bacterium]|nr:MAG: hypothetical protein C4523_10600 [Myxococcales bacterium]
MGRTKSCGCVLGDRIAQAVTTHGLSQTAEWNVWSKMRARCEKPTIKEYKYYGARGITVCDRWQEFENFYADMGPRPSSKHWIEREDTNGDYGPGNCRWATAKEQQNNRRNNRFIEHAGLRLTVAQWAERTGVSAGMVYSRLSKGWPSQKALTAPPGARLKAIRKEMQMSR